MAASSFGDEDVNYLRLQVLVGKVGAQAVRDLFDTSQNFEPTSLQGTLANKRMSLQHLKNRGIVNASQWDLLYPPGGTVPTSEQFDLTLLVLLLRNYGALGEPRNFKWGQLPPPTDVAIFHDLARLKFYRNKYAHATSGITDGDFLADWREIEAAISRIVQPPKKNQVISEIAALLRDPLNQKDLVRVLNQLQTEGSKYTADIIDKIEESTEQVIVQLKANKQAWRQAENQQTITLQTDMNKISENQKEHFETVIDQQTCAMQNQISSVSDSQKEYTKSAIDQLTVTLQTQQECHTQQVLDAIHQSEPQEKMDKIKQLTENTSENVQILEENLKTIYKEKFKPLKASSGDKAPAMFDVTSTLYMDVECKLLEVVCKSHSLGKYQEYTENIKNTAQISRLLSSDSNPGKLPILIEADAGVGKTTLFQRIASNWAENVQELEQFKLVLLIPLCRVKGLKLEDILCDDLNYFPPKHKDNLKCLLDAKRDDILYLIDGLDEVKLHPENDLAELIVEPGRHVLCSCRPMVHDMKVMEKYHGIENYILVKLLGFSEETLKAYINHYFREIRRSNESMADTVMTECSKHFYCKALMKIPLYAGLVCSLMGTVDCEFPDTATVLFNSFLKEIINSYCERYSRPPDGCTNTLHTIHVMTMEKSNFSKSPLEKSVPPAIRRLLKSVSKLAFTTLIEHKLIFTKADANESDLSLHDLIHIGLFTIEKDDGSLIYFRHKLFHEYFAGLYLTQHKNEIHALFDISGEDIINRCHILQNAFFFAAGLCEDTCRRIMFSLNQAIMGIDSNPCRACWVHNKEKRLSFRVCCERCNPEKVDHEHAFNITRVSSCDTCYNFAYEMMFPEDLDTSKLFYGPHGPNLQMQSFCLQLAFENHDTNGSLMASPSSLPVHCSSAHSLAAVLYALRIEKQETHSDLPVSLVLIDGPSLDMDQYLCILKECNNNRDIQGVSLMKASETLIRELLNMKWKHVKKLQFEECDVIVPITRLKVSFPNLEAVLYDRSTWINGKIQTYGGMATHDISVIVNIFQNIPMDALESCPKLQPLFSIYPNMITIWVEDYNNMPARESDKCIPRATIKGICKCRQNCSISFRHVIIADVNEKGVRWIHEDNVKRPGYKGLSLKVINKTLTLSINLCQDDHHVRELLEICRGMKKTKHLCIHKANIMFFQELFKMQWRNVNKVKLSMSDVFVSVDTFAEYFPDVQKVVYDRETVENLNQFTCQEETASTSKEQQRICLVLDVNCDLTPRKVQGHSFHLHVCRLCAKSNSKNIHVRYEEKDCIPKIHEWKFAIRSERNVKGICVRGIPLPYPVFRQFEYCHADIETNLTEALDHNPELQEILLDGIDLNLMQNNQEGIEGIVSKLQKGGQHWKANSVIFGCRCEFKMWKMCSKKSYNLQAYEVPFKVVNAWCNKNKHDINERERFVLHHHVLHQTPIGERKSWQPSMMPVDKIGEDLFEEVAEDEGETDYFSGCGRKDRNVVNALVENFTEQSISVRFNRDSLKE